MMLKSAVKLIRSLSQIELAEIANHVKDEMKTRGMSGWPLGRNKIRKGVCRAKDLIGKLSSSRRGRRLAHGQESVGSDCVKEHAAHDAGEKSKPDIERAEAPS